MARVALSLILALTIFVGLFGATPTSLLAQGGTPAAGTPVAFSQPPEELCTEEEFSGWDSVAEFPKGKSEWQVTPAQASGNKVLYFVVITLEPGKCIPYASPANQKFGAVILIVNQGTIEFTAQPNTIAPTAEAQFGDPDGDGEHPGTRVDFGETIEVTKDQWVSQTAQVWFTYKNIGTEDAIIWKVVWADPITMAGCAGDCK